MDLRSSNMRVLMPSVPMNAGEELLAHKHDDDHTTFILGDSEFEISLLTVTEADASGYPVAYTADFVHTIKGTDPVPFMLIMKGRWHKLKSKKDGSRYACAMPNMKPHALTTGAPPTLKRDEDGHLWAYIDENIMKTHNAMAWVEEHR